MPQPHCLASRLRGTNRWKSHGALLLLAVVALGWIAAGVLGLALCFTDYRSGLWLAPASIALVGCGVAQGSWLWTLWRSGRPGTAHDALFRWVVFRRLGLGVTVGYLAALALGPVPLVVLFWLATVAAWQTCLMLPLAASPKTLDDWRRWIQGRTPRRLAWLIYAPLLILVASEAGLRVERLASETFWLGRNSLPDGSASVSKLTAEPLDFSRLKAGRFRVAVVGDRPDCSEKLSRRVAQVLPGAEIVPLTITRGDADAAERLAAEVDELNPDLVLALLVVCEDLACEPAVRSPFDWRHLELAKRLLGEPSAAQADPPIAGRRFRVVPG